LGDIPFPFLKRGVPLAVIYAPAIRTARVTKRFKIRPVRGPLPRPGRRRRKRIQYEFIAVFDCSSKDPFLAIRGKGGKSHFLRMFEGLRHTNFSISNDWADEKKFR
jgi:hypothetical protein